MTIKQQGGVFGRNPTFNDVEVDGDVTFKDGAKALFGDGGDLQIYHSGSSSTIYDAGTGGLSIGSNLLAIKNSAFTKNGAVFNENADARFFYDGVFKAATTASGFSVTGNVALTDGGGIDFSATAGTGTSELFDDYEEGDHEVAVTAGTSGTITVGASSSVLAYTKIGRQVTLMGRILIGSVASPVGALKISLPFVIGNMTEFGGYVYDMGYFYGNGTGVSDGTSYYTCAFSGTEGQSTINILAISRAGVFDTTAADWVGANSELYVNLTYFTS